MKKNDTVKFEFLFTLGGNIICQRYFNVKDYNPEVRRSIALYETIKDIIAKIQRELKMKSIEFLYENEKFLNTQNEQLADQPEEYFLIQIKLGDDVVIATQFIANLYPPKIRYTVDIRPQIRDFLSLISETLSQPEYEAIYLQTEL